MNVVFYLRYSSNAQREESIEGQLRDCTQFANYNDIDISLEDIENSGILGDITNNGENAKTLDKINGNDIKKSIKKLPEHKCSDNSEFVFVGQNVSF